MLSIYNYSEPHEFLKDCWRASNKKNPSFSLRSWSKKMGFGNTAPLSLMLAGKRPIPKKYVPHFVQDLGLRRAEAQYLETMIDLRRAKTAESKRHYLQRMEDLAPTSSLSMHELKEFKYLEDPIHTIILEMTDLNGFKPDPEWIMNRLSFKCSKARVAEAIDLLISIGLLKRDSKGRVSKTHHNVVSTQDLTDLAVQTYHQTICQLAIDQLPQQHPRDREYSSFSFNINRDELPEAKVAIRQFCEEFIKRFESKPQQGSDTFQLNVQFFSTASKQRGSPS